MAGAFISCDQEVVITEPEVSDAVSVSSKFSMLDYEPWIDKIIWNSAEDIPGGVNLVDMGQYYWHVDKCWWYEYDTFENPQFNLEARMGDVNVGQYFEVPIYFHMRGGDPNIIYQPFLVTPDGEEILSLGRDEVGPKTNYMYGYVQNISYSETENDFLVTVGKTIESEVGEFWIEIRNEQDYSQVFMRLKFNPKWVFQKGL